MFLFLQEKKHLRSIRLFKKANFEKVPTFLEDLKNKMYWNINYRIYV